MFGFDVKEIFKERIYEIIFLLCSVHLGCVMISFVLKCIHPYLKSCSVLHNSHKEVDSFKCLNSGQLQSIFKNQYTKKERKVTVKNAFKNNNTISEEEFVNIMEYLESFCVDVSSIPQEILKKKYNKSSVLNELSLKIDKAINIRKIISDNLKERKSTSEAQTNITINPTFETDCSSPQLTFSCQSKSCDIPVHTSESSDSFESVCSNHSESEQSTIVPINNRVDLHDRLTILGKNRKIHKIETGLFNIKRGALLDVNSLSCDKKMLKPCVESLEVDNHNDYEKQVSQENKILEIAINEFENELKPIKHQIKVLKECLHSFDCCDTNNSVVSDLSSSASDPTTQSECYSEEMSTTCTSDIKSFSSKWSKKLDRKCSPLKVKLQFNRCKPTNEENVPLLSKSNNYKNKTSKNYTFLQSADKLITKPSNEVCILEVGQSATSKWHVNQTTKRTSNNYNKRSPIADMYIKLSNCNSQSSNFVKNNNYSQKSADKNVTCHINVNFNLGAVTLSSTSNKNWIKEREMKPVLCELEDILGERSHS